MEADNKKNNDKKKVSVKSTGNKKVTTNKKILESKVKKSDNKLKNKKIDLEKEREIKKNISNEIALEIKTEVKKQVIKEIKESSLKEGKIIKDNFIHNLLVVNIVIFSIDILFRILSKFDVISYSSLRIFLSSFIFSLIIVFISSLTKRKWLRNTILLFCVFCYAFYNWAQLGFMNFLGVYISFNTSNQAMAVKDYIWDFLASFKLKYYVLYVPFVLTFIYYVLGLRKRKYNKLRINWKYLLILPITVLIGVMYYYSLTLSFMQGEFQVKSNKMLFINPDIPTIAVNQFGATVFGLVDLRAFIFPPEESLDIEFEYEISEEVVAREVLPVLNMLASDSSNSKYDNLNRYFASRKVTDYNEYTGMFKGMNVIFVQIESGSYGLINEKEFPNYYKMYSEGWYWNNYYSPRNSCATGNNEFSLMTGLYSIYNACTTNNYRDNTYFESIFGLFNDLDYSTTSMHNFVDWYYYRRTSHPNMGSTYYGPDRLKIKTGSYGEWPSDVELMEKAFDIILDEDNEGPWMTWITTVTSHQPYSSSSTFGDMYMKYFVQQGYSTTVARYMSKLKVVDEALGYMLKILEEANELDNTLIIMVPDHFPYGLNEKQLLEMYEQGYDDYEKERVPLVMYNPSMTAQVFEDYTSYIDVLPTVANLLGLEYDPRLYMGTDLLSESHESMVIFPDGSWKNEYAYYDASTGKVKEFEVGYYSDQEIMKITNDASLKIAMSTNAIKLDYFSYLEEEIKKYNETATRESSSE